MKTMFTPERHRHLLRLLSEHGRLSLVEAASRLSVSPATARRDFALIAGAGDAFTAGCLFGLHDEQPLPAATLILHPTCSESVRPVAETLAFGRQHGFHSIP
jgi:hypothetical protein